MEREWNAPSSNVILLSFIWYIKSLALEGDNAQSALYRHNLQVHAKIFRSQVVVLNLFLCGLLLMLLAYYVLATNSITANEYRLRTLNVRLISAQERNSELIAEQVGANNHAAILKFARSMSMVESRDGIRIVQPGGIAFWR